MQDRLRKQSTGFTQIPNTLICDNDISAKAKAVYCYLYSRPDEWKFYKSEIIKNFKEGKDAISSALKELEVCGWIKSTQIRDEKGRFSHTEYYIFVSKQNKNESTVTAKPVHGKPATNNTNINNTASKETLEAFLTLWKDYSLTFLKEQGRRGGSKSKAQKKYALLTEKGISSSEIYKFVENHAQQKIGHKDLERLLTIENYIQYKEDE